jgi:hypothetical protein
MARLKGWLAALGALLLGALGVYAAGRMDGRQRADRREDEAYRETRERIDEVDLGNDPDAARRWLHERGQSGSDL